MSLARPACADCGASRHPLSAERCRRCYRLRAKLKRLGREVVQTAGDVQRMAGSMAANGLGGASKLALAALAMEDVGQAITELGEP